MAAAGPTYVDFVPLHSLLDEPDKVVLRVDLAAEGFRKDQLRVQIDKFGRLRISGERSLRADSNRWRRFSKDFQVPEGCDAAAIRARLEKGGALLVTMPRLSSPAPPAQEPKAAGGIDAQGQQKEQQTPPAAEAGEENKEDHKKDARDASMERRDQDEQPAPGGRAAYGFAKSRRSMGWVIVAVILALVSAGLHARYRLMDPSAETAPASTHIVALSNS